MQTSYSHPKESTPLTSAELLTEAACRTASLLLDQQMWCFGQDIRNPEGNVLLRFGFQRHRHPDSVGSSSVYVLTPYPSSQLVLWGFGLFYGQGTCGGMFLKRYQFNPVWTLHAQLPQVVWEPSEFPELQPATTPQERQSIHRLLLGAVRWITGYELWVHETYGPNYRRQCLRQWHKAAVSAEAIAEAWQQLAESLV
jgi:hypothetical protein